MEAACNCLSLRQASRRVTQLYDQALAPLDLRATQFALLRAIERSGPIGWIDSRAVSARQTDAGDFGIGSNGSVR